MPRIRIARFDPTGKPSYHEMRHPPGLNSAGEASDVPAVAILGLLGSFVA